MLAFLLLLATDPGLELFERTVRPMLVNQCLKCHGGDKIRGGWSYRPQKVWKRGRRRSSRSARDPSGSRLLEALEYHNPDFRMPPSGRLPESTIADVRRWIELARPTRDHEENRGGGEESALQLDDRLQHWAYRPMSKDGPPDYPEEHPIDRFIGHKLEQAGGTPSSPAEDHQLLRRLHLSLTGLPPTLEQLRDFEHAPPVERLNQTLDQLLESPTTANGGLDTGWTWAIRGLEWA